MPKLDTTRLARTSTNTTTRGTTRETTSTPVRETTSTTTGGTRGATSSTSSAGTAQPIGTTPAPAIAPPDPATTSLIASEHNAKPVATSIAPKGNARAALLDHLVDARFTPEQRKFLKRAYKELDGNTHLDDHLALRDLAKDLKLTSAVDEILAKHSSTLLPQLLERANVFAGAAELRSLRDIADAMNERASFDVHLSEQLAVARSWAKTDVDRGEVEAMAQALGVSFVPEESRGEKPKRVVLEEIEAVRKSRRLSATSWQGYQKVLDLLAKGEAGHNQHALGRDLKGLWAADLPGSGAGRGAMRILYELDDDKVTIKDLVDYH